MGRESLPRVKLGFFPTPVHRLERLSAALGGPDVYIKRDDLTGLGLGGNKVRKLEFLIGAALEQGCDTLITGGAEQSNHCRQTAAAAAACGLECHLVLGGCGPDVPDGNLLLDRLFGAAIHWTGELRKGEKIPEIADELRAQGRKPYLIPYGGSNSIGAAGFVEGVRELAAQLGETREKITHIIFPSSSGGSQAGLAVGRMLYHQEFEIVGIGIDKGEAGDGPYDEHLAGLANRTAEQFGVPVGFSACDFTVRTEYLGGGYGVVGGLERRAVTMAAETEGILLDPVYTGRAMGALIDMIERKEFNRADTILFWHTGGAPALFHYRRELI